MSQLFNLPGSAGVFWQHFLSPLLFLVGFPFVVGMLTAAEPIARDLMPMPVLLQFGEGRLALTDGFSVELRGCVNERLRDGLGRALHRVEERSGLVFRRDRNGKLAMGEKGVASTLLIESVGPGSAVPVLGEDESYTLEITSIQAVLRAPTVLGVLHGYETLLQLLQSDSNGWFLPVVKISDQPRFPWRGLMIDVARHWQPIEVIKRNLDGMALVKLNVLHLHLADDQGFRIESRTYPRLTEFGSDGHYFTQEQMREIIDYAAARGIRVVPEFDMPGHATAWLAGYPDLASAPGLYAIERRWGVFDPVLDPTNKKVYRMLARFLREMAALFPDAFIHIGGDENNGVQWSANPNIQEFVRAHHLKDNAGLHAYFNTKVHTILTKLGKQLIGWDEILDPGLPAGCVVQSWRGPEGIARATGSGFATVLANGYYIDLCHPAWEHYLNDPVPAGARLTSAQEKLVLGGEATMWSEWVTPETIDSRIWPRTAAIAERLWSPRELRDVPDMYRRLALVSRRLEEAGLRHESYLEPALRRLAGARATTAEMAALREFVNLLEPVKDYERGGQQPDANQFTPLTGLVDCTRPDSAAARTFAAMVDAMVVEPTSAVANSAALSQTLSSWIATTEVLGQGLIIRSPRLQEAAPLVMALKGAAEVGQAALHMLASGTTPAADWLPAQFTKLDQAAQAHAAVELPVVAALKLLVAAAAGQDQRAKFSDEEWSQFLKKIVSPPVNPAATAR